MFAIGKTRVCYASAAEPPQPALVLFLLVLFLAVLSLLCCPCCAVLASQPAAKFTIHEITHNDLYSKPSWFTDLNPAGLIPVIAWKPTDSADLALAGTAAACAIDGVLSIKESLICNEYIEDAYPEPPVSVRVVSGSGCRCGCLESTCSAACKQQRLTDDELLVLMEYMVDSWAA